MAHRNRGLPIKNGPFSMAMLNNQRVTIMEILIMMKI
jgi:hypothetical protein